LKEWSINQADKYFQIIKSACSEIGRNPKIGKNYTKISKNIFGLKTEKHIIFYHQISDEEVEIIRILHERMDLKANIK
jgi:toxin ParE1/3/4